MSRGETWLISGLDLVGRQPEATAARSGRTVSEQFAHRGVAAGLDVLQDGLDRGADLGVVLGPLGFGQAAFEVFDHACRPVLNVASPRNPRAG